MFILLRLKESIREMAMRNIQPKRQSKAKLVELIENLTLRSFSVAWSECAT